MNKKVEVAAVLVTLLIAVASGIFFLGKLDARVDSLAADPEFKRAREGAIQEVRESAEDIGRNLTDLPVGSILAFAGNPDQLPISWRLCDGSLLRGDKFKDSPFYNRPLPRLDGLFLRSTLNVQEVLDIQAEDKLIYDHVHGTAHKHSGETGDGKTHNAPKADHHFEGGNHNHDFTTSTQDREVSDSPTSAGKEPITVLPKNAKVLYILKVI